MSLPKYEIAYIVLSTLSIYTINRFILVFFNKCLVGKSFEFLLYFFYFLTTTFVYLVIKIPILMLFLNIIGLFFITLIYEGSLRKKILSVIFIYTILFVIETIVALVTGYVKLSLTDRGEDYQSLFGLVLIRILTYAIVLLFNNYKEVRSGVNIPILQWFCIFIVPASSLLILLNLLQTEKSSINILHNFLLILLINYSFFYLYNTVTKQHKIFIENILLERLNISQHKQYELMKTSLSQTKSIKHDLKNHLLSMKAMIEHNEIQFLSDYVSNLLEYEYHSNGYLETNNIVIDSILNFKLEEAMQNDIEVVTKVRIPESFEFSAIDITIILGNLFDNAIEAAKKVSMDRRKIFFHMKYSKKRIFIEMENYYDNEIVVKNEEFVTYKGNKRDHGLGIKNIKNTLEKYDGFLDIDYKDNWFKVKALLYVNINEDI